MSYKIATYVTLLLLIVLSLVFYITAMEFSSLQPNQPINPASFPQIISILLIVMCVISFLTTKRRKDEEVEMLNFRYIAYTMVALVVFLLLWEFVGYFYLLMVVLFATLFYLYNDNPDFKKKAISSTAYAFLVGTIIYVIFDSLLGVTF